MRRPSIGRLIAMALAATIVCFFTIDTTMACRFLLRHRHFAPCAPVAVVDTCETTFAPPAPPVVMGDSCCSDPCCGETVVSGPVVESSGCCGGEVVGDVITEMAPPEPPITDTPVPPTPPTTDGPTPADPATAPAPEVDEPATDEPVTDEPAEDDSALPELDEAEETEPLPNDVDAADEDALPELDGADDVPADDDIDALGDPAAGEAEDPLGGLDEDAPAADDMLDDLPADDAGDAADSLDDVLNDSTNLSEPAADVLGFREAAPPTAVATEPVAPIFRQWTDNTGRFQTTARLVRVTDTSVRLLKENGRYTTVQKSRLCPEDLEYVEVMAKQLQQDDANQFASR